MNDEARDVLREIVRTEGREIGGEPRRLQALLADRAGAFKLEINLLVSAAEEGVPAQLLRSSETTPRGATAERLARQLEEGRGFEYTRARWAVDSWASALGVEAGPAPEPDPVLAGGGGAAATRGAADGRVDPETQRRIPPPRLGGGGDSSGGGAAGGGGRAPGANRTKLLVGGGIVLAVIIIAVLIIGGGGENDPEPTTTVPSTTVAPTTLTTTTPSTTGQITPEQVLLNRVPNTGANAYRNTCEALPETAKRDTLRGIPGIRCEPSATVTAFFYQMPNPTSMNNEYTRVAQGLPGGVCNPAQNANFRASTTYTVGSTTRGKILCYIDTDSPPRAHLEYTDDALNIYASVIATDSTANRQQIYQFWLDKGTLS